MPKSIVKVALDVPLNRLFDYLSDNSEIRIGQRVLVPFGRRNQIGIVLSQSDSSDYPIEKLKSVKQVFIDETPLDGELLKLIRFSADYYQYPLGQALLSALPVRLRQVAPAVARKQFIYSLTDLGRSQTVAQLPKRQLVTHRVFSALLASNTVSEAELDTISSSARKAAKQLVANGWASAKQVHLLPVSYTHLDVYKRQAY